MVERLQTITPAGAARGALVVAVFVAVAGMVVAVLALLWLPVVVFVVCAGQSAAVPSRKAPDRAA